MNLSRFQLALNHDDPAVVSNGLNEFKVHVLVQHDAASSIGYHGRVCTKEVHANEIMHPLTPPAIQGLLLEYVRKSPQVEELFVLWALPGRDDDRALSAAHTSCIATVLHCSTSDASFCNAVISRILCDHIKSLHSQLASGNVELIHSTLGLLLAMMRTSQQNCKDVFQKLNLSNPTLDSVIQKGKTVNFQCAQHKHSITTDSRLLVIILVLLVLESSDATAVLELFAERSLMRKVMHSIGRDSMETLQIVLPGVVWALKQNPILAPHVHDIFDGATIRQLVLLYSHKDDAAQVLVHSFLLDLLAFLKQPVTKRGKGPAGGASVAGSVSKCCGYIAQHLQPHSDSRQEEVPHSITLFYCIFFIIASLFYYFWADSHASVVDPTSLAEQEHLKHQRAEIVGPCTFRRVPGHHALPYTAAAGGRHRRQGEGSTARCVHPARRLGWRWSRPE